MTVTTPTIEEFNGVPVAKLQGTVAKLTENPHLADFRFSARNTWIEGTGSRSTIHEWFGVGGEHLHVQEFTFETDHPTLGHGYGPTPHEYVLHALAGCIVGGIATTAANRGIELRSIETFVRGNIDVRGILGIDGDVRNGYQSIDVEIDIDGDGTPEELEALIQASCKRSAVFDTLANPTLVRVGRKAD